jgi:hypothetical protein
MRDSLTEAQTFALSALLEVQPPATVGAFVGETDEGDSVVTYRFATTLEGYPGWNWTVAVAQLPGEEPTVVESELLPAQGALLAPDWVPWSERMDDYRAAQLALGEAASETDDDEDEDDDDEDALGSDTLHGGDLDGVDIDEIDDSSEEIVEIDDFDDSESDDFGADDLEVDEFEPLDFEPVDFEPGESEPDESDLPELGTLELQVDQGDQAEAKGDGGSENPPRVAGRRKRASKEQQHDQGD